VGLRLLRRRDGGAPGKLGRLNAGRARDQTPARHAPLRSCVSQAVGCWVDAARHRSDRKSPHRGAAGEWAGRLPVRQARAAGARPDFRARREHLLSLPRGDGFHGRPGRAHRAPCHPIRRKRPCRGLRPRNRFRSDRRRDGRPWSRAADDLHRADAASRGLPAGPTGGRQSHRARPAGSHPVADRTDGPAPAPGN
jgi:hypothetical protein